LNRKGEPRRLFAVSPFVFCLFHLVFAHSRLGQDNGSRLYSLRDYDGDPWGIEGHLGAPKLVPFLLPPPQQEGEGRGENFSLAIIF